MKGHAYYRKKARECRALLQSARAAQGVQDVQLISSLEELARAFDEEAAAVERGDAKGAEAKVS